MAVFNNWQIENIAYISTRWEAILRFKDMTNKTMLLPVQSNASCKRRHLTVSASRCGMTIHNVLQVESPSLGVKSIAMHAPFGLPIFFFVANWRMVSTWKYSIHGSPERQSFCNDVNNAPMATKSSALGFGPSLRALSMNLWTSCLTFSLPLCSLMFSIKKSTNWSILGWGGFLRLIGDGDVLNIKSALLDERAEGRTSTRRARLLSPVMNVNGCSCGVGEITKPWASWQCLLVLPK